MEYIGYKIGAVAFTVAIYLIFKRKNNFFQEKEREAVSTEVLEYSLNKSVQLGKRKTCTEGQFIRPSIIKRKSDSNLAYAQQNEKTKRGDRQLGKLISKYVPLSYLIENKYFANKTIRVFVDSMKGNKVIVRDNSAVYELDLPETYDIAGQFVLINLSKAGEAIEIKAIHNDN